MIAQVYAMDTPPLDHGRRRLVTAIIPPLLGVVLIWIIYGLDHELSLHLPRYGVLPRQVSGLVGILAAPLVHGDLSHVFNNSAPLLVLGWLMVYFYPKAAWRVLLACWVLDGLGTWIAAREAYHFGASGIVYGLAAFLFFSGVFRKRVALMAVSLIVVFLYGSMVWGVLPLQPKDGPNISWESHLFGAIAGMIMAWFYRKVPPAHVPPPIILEDDPEEPEPTMLIDGDPGDEESGPSSHAPLDRQARPIHFGQCPEQERPLDL